MGVREKTDFRELPEPHAAASRSPRWVGLGLRVRVDRSAKDRVYRLGQWGRKPRSAGTSAVVPRRANGMIRLPDRLQSSLPSRLSPSFKQSHRRHVPVQKYCPVIRRIKDGAAAAGNSPVHGGTGPRPSPSTRNSSSLAVGKSGALGPSSTAFSYELNLMESRLCQSELAGGMALPAVWSKPDDSRTASHVVPRARIQRSQEASGRRSGRRS